jgi:DinB superfamily
MQIITQLQTTRDQTIAYFDLDATSLAKTYAPGKWNILQILHHLADAETVLCERIKRGIAESGSLVFLFDQDKWNENLHYSEIPLSLSKNIFLATRNQVIYLTEQFYETHGTNTFFQVQVGVRTVKEEIDKVLWHNEKHLVHIQKALAI